MARQATSAAQRLTAAAEALRDEKFNARRIELAEAALETLGELGFARTSLREIAQNSAFTHGVFHYYFSDKLDLICCCVRYYKAKCVTRYDEVVASAKTRDELAEGFLAKLATTLHEDARMHRLWYDLRSQAMFEFVPQGCSRDRQEPGGDDLADSLALCRAEQEEAGDVAGRALCAVRWLVPERVAPTSRERRGGDSGISRRNQACAADHSLRRSAGRRRASAQPPVSDRDQRDPGSKAVAGSFPDRQSPNCWLDWPLRHSRWSSQFVRAPGKVFFALSGHKRSVFRRLNSYRRSAIAAIRASSSRRPAGCPLWVQDSEELAVSTTSPPYPRTADVKAISQEVRVGPILLKKSTLAPVDRR